MVVGILAVVVSVTIAALVALSVIVLDAWGSRHVRTGADPRLPPPEAPRDTVGPVGELIDLDESRHRLMELR